MNIYKKLSTILIYISTYIAVMGQTGPPPLTGPTTVCINSTITYTSTLLCSGDGYQGWSMENPSGSWTTIQLNACDDNGANTYTYTFTSSGTYNLYYGIIVCDDEGGCIPITNYNYYTITVINNTAYLCGNYSSTATVNSSQYIYAGNYCSSPGTTDIQSGANVTATAGDAILINPGFTAESGSVFTASIQSSICATAKMGTMEAGNTMVYRIEENLSVFPNPTTGNVIITLPIGQSNAEVRIYNSQGEEVYSDTDVNFPTLNIDLSAQESGIYYLKIKTNNGVVNKKLILAK